MKHKFYAHIPDLKASSYLNSLECFKQSWEFKQTHPNHYGKLELADGEINIFLGKLLINGCPYCGYKLRNLIKKKSPFETLNPFYQLQIECSGCNARGPSKEFSVCDDSMFDYIEKLLWQEFTTPLNFQKRIDHEITNS